MGLLRLKNYVSSAVSSAFVGVRYHTVEYSLVSTRETAGYLGSSS